MQKLESYDGRAIFLFSIDILRMLWSPGEVSLWFITQATCDGNVSESIVCADDLTSALETCAYSILNSFLVDCWPLSTTLK